MNQSELEKYRKTCYRVGTNAVFNNLKINVSLYNLIHNILKRVTELDDNVTMPPRVLVNNSDDIELIWLRKHDYHILQFTTDCSMIYKPQALEPKFYNRNVLESALEIIHEIHKENKIAQED